MSKQLALRRDGNGGLDQIANVDPALAPGDFREAMRSLPGGVNVITVGRGAAISGMTVTSVSALSLEPPTVIVCINRQSSSWPILQRERAFGVNILSATQRGTADRFTGKGGLKGPERFGAEAWTTLQTGAPILTESLVALDCVADDIIERHSHAIVIGAVQAIHRSTAGAGLVYWRGRYSAVV